MIRARRFLAIILLTTVVGCSGHSAVKVQPTPGTDFSKYQTYAIKPGNVSYPGAAAAEREAIERIVQNTIAARLESQGLVPQPDAPDLVVTYTVGARNNSGPAVTSRPPVGVDSRAPGGNPYDEPGAVMTREGPDASADAELRAGNVDGNLVIDLLDGKSRRLVWRATSRLDLTASRRARVIQSVVDDAFAGLALHGMGNAQTQPSTQPDSHSPPASTPSE